MAKKIHDGKLKKIRHTFKRNEIVKLYRKDPMFPEFPVGFHFIVKSDATPATFIGVGFIGSNRIFMVRVCDLARVKP